MGFKVSPAIVCPPLLVGYKLWTRSLRITIEGDDAVFAAREAGQKMLFGIWHGELFPLPCMRHHRGITMFGVASMSRDGEYVSRVIEGLGVVAVRGSSSRGGTKALRGALKALDDGHCGLLTVDGPRGPRFVPKNGIFYLAERGGSHIVPVRAFMERTKVFEKAWDKFQLPLPFSRVRIVCGTPYRLDHEEMTPEALEYERARFKEKMDALV